MLFGLFLVTLQVKTLRQGDKEASTESQGPGPVELALELALPVPN